MEAESLKKLHKACRRHVPATVHAFDGDGNATVLKPTGQRGRWERLLEAVPPATLRCELREKDGTTVAAIDCERELETPDTTVNVKTEAAQLLGLMLKSQEVVLGHSRTEMADMVKGYKELADLVCGQLGGALARVTELEAQVDGLQDALRELRAAAGEASSGSDGLMQKVLTMGAKALGVGDAPGTNGAGGAE